MGKYAHLPEVAELERFVIESGIDTYVAEQIMSNIRLAGETGLYIPIPPLVFWGLVARIGARCEAIVKAEGA